MTGTTKSLIPTSDITLLILSGGKSQRMGKIDKGLIDLGGKPMISHTLDQFSKDFSQILISANQQIETYQAFGYPVIQDKMTDIGPLGGIATAIKQANTHYLLIMPCDTPRMNKQIFQSLIHAASKSSHQIYVAHDGKQLQMLHALLDISSGILEKSLSNYLKTDRKVQLWYEQHDLYPVDCSKYSALFENVNTPETLKKLARYPK